MTSLHNYIRFLRWHLGHTLPMIVRHPSTYPELPRKSALRRYFENLYIYIRDGEPCAAYDGLGLDIKGRKLNDFISNLFWIRFLYWHLTSVGLTVSTPMQRLMHDGCSPIHILQNKYCFWSFMERHGIPVVPVIAHTIGGTLFDSTPEGNLSALDRFFVKPVDGNCGTSACAVIVKDGCFYTDDHQLNLEAFVSQDREYIFQPIIENHPDIKALNHTTLNTLRLATCRTNEGKLELWDSGMLRIGRSGSDVDNFAKGGIGVGVDDKGCLKKYGYTHDEKLCYKKLECHPDSQVLFEGRKLPFYEDAVALVLKAHALFPKLQSIGWDIAITSEGPILVEGNHDWDMEMLQVVHHKGAAGRFKEIYG